MFYSDNTKVEALDIILDYLADLRKYILIDG